jgi:cysteine desulfurase
MTIYADNAATTKPSRAALDAMIDCLENNYGNPSSLYSLGFKAAQAIESARAFVSKSWDAGATKFILLQAAANPTIRPSSLRRSRASAAGKRISFQPHLNTMLFCIRWIS